MKKVLLALLLSLSVVSVADAKISEDRIAIGGIYAGQTQEQVKEIYGNPVRKSQGEFWFYNQNENTKFEIYFENKVVRHVRTKGNTGLATPDGIKVGSSKDDIINAYGQPDMYEKGGAFKAHPDSYFYRYYPTNGKTIWLDFEVRYGKVLRMEVATYENLE